MLHALITQLIVLCDAACGATGSVVCAAVVLCVVLLMLHAVVLN
jgi:hypothetical protein